MRIVLLVFAAVVALPSAALAEAAVDASASRPPVQLETRLFEMRKGRAFELALCDRHGPATWSAYACWAFNAGKQAGSWVGGDLLTVGVRLRPYRGPISFIAGAGGGLGTIAINGLLSAFCNGPPRDGPDGTENDRAEKCDPGQLLPVELAAEVGVRARVRAGRMGVELQALGRYHGPVVTRLGRSMAGPMTAVGVALMF
jgi:hypothetical protein